MGTVVSVFCFLCEVCSLGEETVVITEADCVHCVMRAKAEETVEHVTKHSTSKWQHSV